MSKKIDRNYWINDSIQLHEGLNTLDDTYEIEITNGEVTCFRAYDSKIINRVFGWSNWRRFLLGGSPYFCLGFLTLFAFWIYNYKDRDNPLFQKTVVIVLSFFGLVAGWFIFYSLYPKPDIPYSWYYALLLIGSLLINAGTILFIRWARRRQLTIDELTSRIHSLTHYISSRIYGRYIQKQDKKEYLIETLSKYQDITTDNSASK